MTSKPLAEHDLSELVDEWIDWATAASLLGVTVGKVRTMIREHELAAAVPPGIKGQHIPALFIQDGLPVKGLGGLLHVLHDGRYDDREIVAWLFLGHHQRHCPHIPPAGCAAGDAGGAGGGRLSLGLV